MNLNKVFLIGRLTRDPEVRALASGQQVASFGLATDRHYQDKSGQKQRKTEFHNIVIFGRLAEIASQYLTKGSLAMIEGRLQTRTWQDNAGSNRSRTEVVAQSLQLGPKSAGKITLAEGKDVPEVADADASSSPSLRSEKEDIPVIDEEEIDVKDLPL